MKSALIRAACAFGFVSVALAGCKRNADREGQQTNEPLATDQPNTNEPKTEGRTPEEQRRSIGGGPAGATPRSTALSSIAAARCDRDVKCKHVGPNEKYKTRDDCFTEMQRKQKDDLKPDWCPKVDQHGLDNCLKSIRDEDCGHPLDTISRLNACGTNSLCTK